MLEKDINEYGQKQIINSLDKIVKIENKFLQVRLIRTEKWENREELTKPMPRARFVDSSNVPKNFYYLVNKEDLIKLKSEKK